MKKIKLLIVDDEILIREGLKIIMDNFTDIEVISTGANGIEAIEYCRNNPCDLILMDIRMPNCDGVLATKLIKEHHPDIKILILTTFKDTTYIQDALKYGASGYLLKNSTPDLIYGGIKAALEGTVVVHPDILNKIMIKQESNMTFNDILTERELDIIKEIANGLSNKEISEKMFLSEGTVKNHITTILNKLELRDRTQIAIFAYKNDIAI